MIPVGFDYQRPESVDAALALLAEHGDDATVLAGGHSLLPVMKLRLAAPEVVIDIGRVAELNYIRVDGDEIAIGAGTRYRDIVISDVLAKECALLPAVTRTVGDPQVRHRGTLGGALAHGDPAGDLPAAILALEGTIVLRSPRGERKVPITEFYTGVFSSVKEPDELIVEIRVPRTGSTGWAYEKFTRRSNDWAIVAVAVVTAADGARRIGLVNMGSTPLRAKATEAALAEGKSIEEAAALAAEGTEPPADNAGTPEYRRHLVTVLTRRALQTAAG
ncbi:xanthine dehydrogenase family protein subunit M [Pseudonocardia halophobica]|uniref:Carbon-monoxide dehydrogenase medium subunit n=1 Tax=Pseudonocardia halophobica TaxID=29401 RepID=A0A9W6L8B1_9PSEU|nr:xanthine dehydrogenase family protein subunit M [Pseudonocardia halophobica]GLL13716.1 carbon-monoxide dehydrogenase medium subunit [Pseudonocardia halophobica]